MSEVTVRLGASYAHLAANRDLVVCVEGRRGTGKTRAALSLMLARGLKWPGSRILIGRQFRAILTQTVLVTLEDQVFPSFGLPVPGAAKRDHRSQYELPNGSVLVPAGVDEGQKMLSSEWSFAYIAQAEELDRKTAMDLKGCMRWMRSPERPGLADFAQVVYDFNPVNPQHWGNTLPEACGDDLRAVRTPADYLRLQEHNQRPAADPNNKPKRIVTCHQDNPGYWDHGSWSLTALGERYVNGVLGSYQGFQRSRWLDGLWVAAEGSVYAGAFDEKRNLIEPFALPASWPVWVYMDFGEDHPTAIGWFTIAPSGKKILVAEIHRRNIGGVPATAALIHEVNRRLDVKPLGYFGDPRHGFSTTFQSTATIAEQFESCGIHVQPYGRFQGKGVHASVELVRTDFQSGGLLFFSDCTGFIADHQAWAYKRTATGDLPGGDDAYEDRNNDACDVTRAFVARKHTRDGVTADPDANELELVQRKLWELEGRHRSDADAD